MAQYQKDVVKLYKDGLKRASDIASRVLTALVVAAGDVGVVHLFVFLSGRKPGSVQIVVRRVGEK